MVDVRGDVLKLPAYFGKHGNFEMSDPLYISQFYIWTNSKKEVTKLKSLNLPSYLLGLKGIALQSFIQGLKHTKW